MRSTWALLLLVFHNDFFAGPEIVGIITLDWAVAYPRQFPLNASFAILACPHAVLADLRISIASSCVTLHASVIPSNMYASVCHMTGSAQMRKHRVCFPRKNEPQLITVTCEEWTSQAACNIDGCTGDEIDAPNRENNLGEGRTFIVWPTTRTFNSLDQPWCGSKLIAVRFSEMRSSFSPIYVSAIGSSASRLVSDQKWFRCPMSIFGHLSFYRRIWATSENFNACILIYWWVRHSTKKKSASPDGLHSKCPFMDRFWSAANGRPWRATRLSIFIQRQGKA